MRKHYDFSKAKRGAVVAVPKGKSRITIRLDDAIIDWFKTQVEEAGGGNYQSLINAALREHIGRLDEPLERKVVLRSRLRDRHEAFRTARFRRKFGGPGKSAAL